MPADAPDVLLDARGLGRSLGVAPRAPSRQGGQRAGDEATDERTSPGRAVGGIRDVTLSLRAGDVLALLGLNGAGKSTALRLLAGVLAPDEGSVSIAGHSLEDEPLEARARLGYLPDVPPLYPDLRVDDYLTLAGRLRRLRGADLAAALERVLERCALTEVRRRRIGALSKGFRQRVGLAQALIHAPAVVLLDEPGNGLDPQQGGTLADIVGEAARECCVVLSTHLPHEARELCNRVALVHEGRMVAEHAADEADLDAVFERLARGAAPEPGPGPGPGPEPEPEPEPGPEPEAEATRR